MKERRPSRQTIGDPGYRQSNASKLGHKNIRDLCEAFGVPYCRLFNWIRTGTVPAPSHRVLNSRRRYYTADEFAELVRAYKEMMD
jgi:hypothetical protein